MTDFDFVIVGAGVAGMSTARALEDSGLSVQILESKARIGGRANTDNDTFSVPFDRGCAWMSGGLDNPLVQFADECSFESVERGHALIDDKIFVGTAAGAWLDDEDARKRDHHYIEGCYRAIDTEARQGRDVSIADVIDTTSTWTSHLNNSLKLVQGGEIETLSILDFANGEADGDRFQLLRGYGSLIHEFGKGLPVDLGAAVESIDWGGDGVETLTSKGAVSSQVVIVTVSTGVLAANRIRFEPGLPDTTRAAIAALPMGRLTKVAIQFDRNVYGSFTDDSFIYYDGPRSSLNIIPSYVGGSYSVAVAGHSGARLALAEPIANRLFFAGEATSAHHYGLAHGALIEGRAAAERVVARLR